MLTKLLLNTNNMGKSIWRQVKNETCNQACYQAGSKSDLVTDTIWRVAAPIKTQVWRRASEQVQNQLRG